MGRQWTYGLVFFLASSFAAGDAQAQAPGALYIESNSPSANTILKFDRNSDGSLAPSGEFATGGKGTGTGLGNQGGLLLTKGDRFLLAINSGSNDVSVLAVGENGLRLVDRKPSGGLRPISITEDHGLVYVLNNGGAASGIDNISGFRISSRGYLTPIPGSTQTLSAPSVGPAQIHFNEEGNSLIVTEKNTNTIDVYRVNDYGVAGNRISYPSNGATPFGFALGKRGQVFVTDAAGGAPNASAVSGYELSESGLKAIGGASATNRTSACWAAVTHDGRFVYSANTGDNTISAFSIAHDGTLSLLNDNGSAAPADGAPADLAFSDGDRFLYVVNGAAHSINAYAVHQDGSLSPAGGISGLPAGSTGLAAR